MQNELNLRVLRLMFGEAQRSLPPSRDKMASLLGVSRDAIDRALFGLERAGLADAERARLTMMGLGFAAATRRPRSRAARDVVLAA
jgi:hypothetical protein